MRRRESDLDCKTSVRHHHRPYLLVILVILVVIVILVIFIIIIVIIPKSESHITIYLSPPPTCLLRRIFQVIVKIKLTL